jgi:hypothetical protein
MTKEPIVYNKKNENLAKPAFVRIANKIDFSVGAMELMQIRAGLKLHFVSFADDEWYLMLDEDPNGYNIRVDSYGRAECYAAASCKIFREKAANSQENVAYMVEWSSVELRGKRLWKINTKKTYSAEKYK